MKTTAVLAAVSSLGLLGGMSQRVLAEAIHVDPMPWTAQLGVCGGCLTILLLTIVRVIPKMGEEFRKSVSEMSERHSGDLKELSKTHAEGFSELRTEIGGVRTEIRAGNDSQLALLRNVLHQKDADTTKGPNAQ